MPGAVKSRLTPHLDQQQAALLHDAFLRDALLRALTVPGVTVSLIHPAGTDSRLLSGLSPEGVTCIAEHGADVGEAMSAAFRSLFEGGAERVVLTGADLPSLPASRIDEAFAALERADVVLGPAEDGGYYLIGLRSPCAALFEDMAWSTDRVLEQTLARAATLGLRVTLLAPWYDVDTPAELQRLIADLAADPDFEAPATRQALALIVTDASVPSLTV